jgi:AcrR family transcriptional regulator
MARSREMADEHTESGVGGRRLRSDAAANRERVLAAAAVGVGTLYRHYPSREHLLDALVLRSFRLVVRHARAAAGSRESAPTALTGFFEDTISARDELVLPMHGGPVNNSQPIVELREQVRDLLQQILCRGYEEGTIRQDVTATDIIVAGAMLAQPLPHTSNWGDVARRHARIYVAGLAAIADTPSPELD